MARVDAPACDSSATVLESYPSTARRPLLCAVLQPLHPYAYSTYRQIFARFDPHLGHARLLAPPKRIAADLPSGGSVGPWRYRCGYSEYANTRAAHHCTAAHSRLSEVRAPLTPQLAVAAGLRLGTTECAEAQFRGSERIISNARAECGKFARSVGRAGREPRSRCRPRPRHCGERRRQPLLHPPSTSAPLLASAALGERHPGPRSTDTSARPCLLLACVRLYSNHPEAAQGVAQARCSPGKHSCPQVRNIHLRTSRFP